jgi:hypothetical protein
MIRQFRPYAGHTDEVRPQVGFSDIRGYVSTICRQAQAHERIFLHVV